MTDSLHETFGQIGISKASDDFSHPQSEAILKGAREILHQIPTGARLLEFANNHSVPVKVISAREFDFSVINANQVVLYALPQIPKDFHILAMALGCGIRQVEHKFIGWQGDGTPPKTPQESAIFLSKNIDNIMTMCKIADEYSVEGYSKLIDVVEQLGYVDIYKAYKSGKGFEEISSIMIKNAKDYGKIRKEG